MVNNIDGGNVSQQSGFSQIIPTAAANSMNASGGSSTNGSRKECGGAGIIGIGIEREKNLFASHFHERDRLIREHQLKQRFIMKRNYNHNGDANNKYDNGGGGGVAEITPSICKKAISNSSHHRNQTDVYQTKKLCRQIENFGAAPIKGELNTHTHSFQLKGVVCFFSVNGI